MSNDGLTNCSKETMDETGLPGRPKTGFPSIVPKAKGFPGFIATFQKTISIPDDAWVDWDAANQKWLTAADAAKAKAIMDQFGKDSKAAADKLTVAKFDDKALVQFITDLGASYAKAANTKLDLAATLASKDNVDSITAEIKAIGDLKTGLLRI